MQFNKFILQPFILFIYFISNISSLDVDLSLLKVPKSKTITTPEYFDNDFYYLIPICIGTPFQCINVLYETNYTHLILTDINNNDQIAFFDSLKSSSYQSHNNTLDVCGSKGESSEDNFALEFEEFNFSFLLPYSYPKKYQFFDGVMGLGLQYSSNSIYNTNFSLIDALYNKNIINRRIFGHKHFNDDRRYIKLFLGEITDREYKEKYGDRKDYPKCYCDYSKKFLENKVDSSLGKVWSCSIEKITIYLGDKKLKELDNSVSSVIFSTGSNIITGPIEEGEKLINILIDSVSEKGKCKTIIFNGDKLSLNCHWNLDIYQFPTIRFILGTVELVLQPKNIFYKEFDLSGDRYVYKTRFEFGPNQKYWSFGQPILREYDMVFDMEEGSVGFWNVEGGINKSRLIRRIGIICFIIIIVTFLVIIGIYYFKRKILNSPEGKEKQRLLSNITKMAEIEIP